MKKIMIFLISFLLILPSLSVGAENVNAQGETETMSVQKTTDNTEETIYFDAEDKQQIEEDIIFYFSEVGYIDENNEYIVTDIEAFLERLNSEKIKENTDRVNQPTFRSTGVTDYALCVVANAIPVPFSGTAYELGVALANDSDFTDAIIQGSADLATEIFTDYATQYLGPEMLQEFTNVGLVSSIATALVSCGLD